MAMNEKCGILKQGKDEVNYMLLFLLSSWYIVRTRSVISIFTSAWRRLVKPKGRATLIVLSGIILIFTSASGGG